MDNEWTERGKPVPFPDDIHTDSEGVIVPEPEVHHAWEWREIERRHAERRKVVMTSATAAAAFYHAGELERSSNLPNIVGTNLGATLHRAAAFLSDLAERANT